MTSWKDEILNELKFKTSRSSGSGGQHVNKVESRVEVIVNIEECLSLSTEQKRQVLLRLKNRIDKSGNLSVSSSTSRSQKQNKKFGIHRILELINYTERRKSERRPNSKSCKRKTTEG